MGGDKYHKIQSLMHEKLKKKIENIKELPSHLVLVCDKIIVARNFYFI